MQPRNRDSESTDGAGGTGKKCDGDDLPSGPLSLCVDDRLLSEVSTETGNWVNNLDCDADLYFFFFYFGVEQLAEPV